VLQLLGREQEVGQGLLWPLLHEGTKQKRPPASYYFDSEDIAIAVLRVPQFVTTKVNVDIEKESLSSSPRPAPS
jgi:hypothetical protein